MKIITISGTTPFSPLSKKVVEYMIDIRMMNLEYNYNIMTSPLILSVATGKHHAHVKKCIMVLLKNDFITRHKEHALYFITKDQIDFYFTALEKYVPIPKGNRFTEKKQRWLYKEIEDNA